MTTSKIITWAVAITVIGAAAAEIFGLQFRRLFCPHPREKLHMKGGELLCERCGKTVYLWE